MDPHTKHYVTGAIAVAVALAASIPLARMTASPPLVQHLIERQIQTTAKYSWGELTAAEQQAIVAALGDTVKGAKVEIFCGGGWCNDLAEDFDEVMDRAGADSAHHRPMIESLGADNKPVAAIGIAPDDARTRAIVEAIKAATGGRLTLQIVPELQQGQKDKVVILIGRKPRK